MIKRRGIRLTLHPLFVLLMLVAVAAGQFAELATLFAIVLVHELGHLAAALHFGWSVREIKLLPFGGVVEVEDAGALPVREEAVVALAGPAQNAVMAGLAWVAWWAGWIDASWMGRLVQANALIGLFNLLPILPLDGGKVMQAWLSLRLPYHRALLWSARISLLFSVLLTASAVYPLLQGDRLQLNLLAVGLFLLASNRTYLRNVPYVFLRFLVHRARRSERRTEAGALAQPIVLAAERPVSAAVRLLMKEKYHLIYMMSRGRIVKVVPEGQVIDGYLGRLTGGHADLRFFM